MKIVKCPRCSAQVVATAAGECPSCRGVIALPAAEAAPSATGFREGSEAVSVTGAFRPAAAVDTNPYASPSLFEPKPTPASGGQLKGDWVWVLFSFDGRIPRRTYWMSVIGMGIVQYAVIFGVFLALTGGDLMKIDDNQELAHRFDNVSLIINVISLLFLWPNLAVAIKRWHDLNKSGWWVLISLIPCVGAIWALIETGFFRGTYGDNNYGPDPTSA